MKKLTKIFALALCLVTVIGIFAGCSQNKSKEPITSEAFLTHAKGKGFKEVQMSDQIKELAGSQDIVIVEAPEEAFRVTYFKIENKETAEGMYNSNKTRYEALDDKTNASTIDEGSNYGKYTIITDKDYIVASYIADTFVFIHTDKTNQEGVDTFLKDINY